MGRKYTWTRSLFSLHAPIAIIVSFILLMGAVFVLKMTYIQKDVSLQGVTTDKSIEIMLTLSHQEDLALTLNRTDVQTVTIQTSMFEMDMGTTTTPLKKSGHQWVGNVSLNMAGTWLMRVQIATTTLHYAEFHLKI